MRLKLDALNLTLKGFAPEAAQRLTRELPGALERAVAHPRVAPKGLADRVARQVVDEVRKRRGDA
ncbi:hypothetical protein [Roseitranquillus sediminis]|uniref:hypothetical protein n=1 Tax=Roseitranquillus sediminis TaxID=2809051 RepID=UPI001D0C6ADE|nr:hypothetical protein [Roseitranquillus sediminis]MBM9594983.1 hypothetical protein [Roseitranquillus sediminis]